MIQLHDQDQTYIPESTDECVQLALRESYNRNYDDSDRSVKKAAQNRYQGKLAEAQVCLALKNVGFNIIHGIRIEKKFADSGADLTIKGYDHIIRPIQIKSCGKYINFYNREFTTAECNANKLCRFAGPIIVKSINKDKVKWYCTDGEEIYRNLKSSHIDGYYVPISALRDEIVDFSHISLITFFERHSKPHFSQESKVA